MLMTSGPIVPEVASSWVTLPVAEFLTSYFVLMRSSGGMGEIKSKLQSGAPALHERNAESSGRLGFDDQRTDVRRRRSHGPCAAQWRRTRRKTAPAAQGRR